VIVVWLFVVAIIVWAIVIYTCITLAISVAHWGIPSVRLCLLRRLLLVLRPVLVGVVLPAGAAEVAAGEVGKSPWRGTRHEKGKTRLHLSRRIFSATLRLR
jgi:hypothetical protein